VSQKSKHQLPKKIWFLWLQGYKNMPEIVKKCYESWRKYNEDWETIFLDENNLSEYIDISALLNDRIIPIPRAALSDIIRINLMEKYGGVWVDATCFCCRPLDDWIHNHLNSGFFAFNRPGVDRMLSSWFLAAHTGNELAEIYANTVNQFWQKHKKLTFISQKILLRKLFLRTKLHRYLKKNPPRWFNWIFLNLLNIYPYYWFHYTFEKLYQKSKVVKNIWDQTPKISADIPHQLWNHGLDQPINEHLQNHIIRKESPLYKLTWKVSEEMFKEGNTLRFLLYESGV